MEADQIIDVAAIADQYRRVLEEVIGRHLNANQRLLIRVTDVEKQPADQRRPPQSLDDWTTVFDGLSDADIESIDKIAKTRADLTRHLP